MAGKRLAPRTVALVAAVAAISLTLIAGGCAPKASTGTGGSAAPTNPVADQTQVRQVIQQLYGAMTTERYDLVRKLLTGVAARYPATTWQRDMTLVVGLEVTSVKVAGEHAEVTVVERVRDKAGNAGVTQTHYVLTKTPAGWKIASAQFAD